MKKTYQATDAPAIFGADSGRPASSVTSLDDLKKMGAQFDGNSAMLNDEWSFPDMQTLLDNEWIQRQLTRNGGRNYTTLVCGERTRNNVTKLAWFNLGSLTRQDVNREVIFPEWADLGNDFARLDKLAGRTFKVTKTKEAMMTKWDNGVIIEGESVKMDIPVVPIQ